jgi:hypothetical protein
MGLRSQWSDTLQVPKHGIGNHVWMLRYMRLGSKAFKILDLIVFFTNAVSVFMVDVVSFWNWTSTGLPDLDVQISDSPLPEIASR